MGNAQSGGPPSQFVVQSKGDWEKQLKRVLVTAPTLTKTVILPPGIKLSDPRLAQGEVIEEKTYRLDKDELGSWPTETPFEVDVDKNLVPPCWGKPNVSAHYAIYPDDRFEGAPKCGLCELTARSRREQEWQ